MSENLINADADAPDRRPFTTLLQRISASKNAEVAPMPSSKPLQIFLLIALVITGAAYVANQWIEMTTEEARRKYPSRLHELVQSQSIFLEHTEAGNKALARKRPDQAVSEFRMALEAQQSAEGHQNLGIALLQLGNPDAAFAQFREAVRLDPGMMTAYDAWGRALASEGKPEEAVTVYQLALQRNPDSGIIHYSLAVTLQQMQRIAVAARRAAEAEGKSTDATTADEQSKRLAAQSLQQYTRASRTGVDSSQFWTGYGELLNDQGRFSDAESSLNRAVSEDPARADAHFQLARAQAHLGKYADAIGHYEKVLTLTPDNPEVLNSLALLYTTATNTEVHSARMAVQLATRACDATTSQNARFMDTLARAYAASGDFFQAITWEDKAMKRARQLSDDELTRELQPRYELYLDHKTD
ncbi:MAG TPA: tetratricopeptide repeat protein [Candidatus Baltobacteraceae bacterium]|jgi:tetratricopeptide (TPR) repeat protein|nr:tetratricopeptide repeat protein [Candidatus Baltobacteraceae bacterium]